MYIQAKPNDRPGSLVMFKKDRFLNIRSWDGPFTLETESIIIKRSTNEYSYGLHRFSFLAESDLTNSLLINVRSEDPDERDAAIAEVLKHGREGSKHSMQDIPHAARASTDKSLIISPSSIWTSTGSQANLWENLAVLKQVMDCWSTGMNFVPEGFTVPHRHTTRQAREKV